MDGVPDLSALLKGKLQLLTKKSTTVDPQGPSNSGVDVTSEGGGTSREGDSKEGASREEGPIAIDQGGRAETSASGPKKKKKTKRTKVGATEEVPPEESASLDATSEGSKAKKKKDGRKRSRGGEASSADRGEGLAEGQEAVLVGAASDGHPRKRTKRSVEAEPRPSTSDANAADATLVDAFVIRIPIAYPEKFFESAQAIAAHRHLRWPDLSRKWIRRQQARIARVDWESRLPCVLGPRKSRLPLCTRKQQRLLDKAREMDGVPDLSACGGTSREGASKEGASREEGPIAFDQGGRQRLLLQGSKAKKKKDGGKRSRGGAEGQEAVLVRAASDGHPRKRTKRFVEAEPRPSTSDANAADAVLVDAVVEASGTPENLSEERRNTCLREGGSGGEPARSTLDSSTRKRSGSEGSVAKRKRIEFPDHVEFSYNETTPLILNPLRCTELTRQIRGGTKEMPQLEDLYFKNEYIDAASSRARSDGSMNFLVDKNDSALKQTMIQLGSTEKLAQARLKAIERVRAQHKKANKKAAKEKEVLRVKFEELEGKLKSAGAAKKELARENTRLEQAAATLEKEKTELLEERDAAVEKLIGERQRLRDSRGLEVTRERERVEAAMVEKANRCFGRVRDHFTRLDAFGKAKNLYGQASETKKCLEMIKASGAEIPQEMIDVFAEQEKFYVAEATKFCVGPLSDSDLTLSPRVLPSRFVEDRFRASFDPYGSNVNLIRPGTVSQLITSLEITEEPSEEPLVDVTSVPAEHVEVPEGGGLGERPENKNLEEVPGKDNLEVGNIPVREEETENVGIEDPVLVSDSSSEGLEDEEEEDDRLEETSPSQPIEEEKTNEVGNRDVPSPPAVASLAPVPTRVEDPTAAATEDPVGSSALGTPEERIEFPDRVEFSYNETTPLILNPLRCAELTRQIRGGTKEMPQLEDLYFKNEYIDAASSRARSDGSMNFLVEKYDHALKQTMIQLGSSEKLAQARLKAIERVRAEHKKANEKASKKKEVLRVKFEELEAAATLDKEKTELLEERDAAVEKLIGERQCLRDSRGLKVTRERERVEAAMVEKANRCFGRVRDHFTRLDTFGKAKNMYGQASGTKKCLQMIKASGMEIPQEMIDVFAEQEKLYEAEATKFCVGLKRRLIRPGTVSQLITSLEITEEPSEEPLVDVTSVPAEHVEVLEGGGLDERPENENREEVPGKDNLETGSTPVREEETENMGIKDPVLVSDSSSEGREDKEEEDDRVEETSLSQPVEEETTNEVGNRDVPPPPAVASLVPVPTRVEDPTAAATEDPVGPSALGTPEEVGQDSAP
ncbi:hypothetical protein F2Q69_00006155 [Brassica cretica]|uniref:Uncharacterized protein n=1 Tax=Brassica cretica TaxID=69181 RepID=A0A8S9P8M0_BRACR|nr:hypothetical protein F2Q69_00006155 [Brassica cretica]